MGPKFNNPPVVERVIGLQFTGLAFFTNAHAGWFWKQYLGPEWKQISGAPKIADKLERFGEPRRGVSPGLSIAQSGEPERSLIVRDPDDQMIQVQNTRFLLNWRKKPSLDYPDFYNLLDEFFGHFDQFSSFVGEASEEEIKLNQWEVTYVNHIPKGDMWDTVNDWKDVFADFSLPGDAMKNGAVETCGLDWSINLPGEVGRLHVNLKHAFAGAPDGQEIIRLEITCRGPISKNGIRNDFQVGHDSVVNTFADITSKEAHERWERVK